MSETLIQVQALSKEFIGKSPGLFGKQRIFKAVDNISFSIKKAEIFGVVGESGCGKSTTGRMLVGLIKPSSGRVFFKGEELTGRTEKQMRPMRRNLQMVFQNPYGSLNPKMTLDQIMEEPLKIFKVAVRDRRKRIHTLVNQVGLQKSVLYRYPWELSGGQCQRIAIARALALSPEFIVADEAVSALDVSIQAQILNLLMDLQKELSLTCLFISHDLSVVHYISDRIAVMYQGEIVELADCSRIYNHPFHPYTRLLMTSIPIPDPDTPFAFNSDPAGPAGISQSFSGCRFAPRCSEKTDICSRIRPELKELATGHFAACHKSNSINRTIEKERRHGT